MMKQHTDRGQRTAQIAGQMSGQSADATLTQPSPDPTGNVRAKRKKKHEAPWKKKPWCVWLVISIALSAYLTVCMPSPSVPEYKAATGGISAQTSGQMRTHGISRDKSQEIADRASDSKGSSMAKQKRMREQQPDDPLSRLLYRLKVFGRLFLFVGLGAMLGAIIEGRCWYRFLSRTLGRLTRAARMPGIVGASIPTALASAPAADSMLVASHARGELSSSTLIAGGMINSFLAHFSHTMRIFYPVVAAIGLPGLAYFCIQFSGMGVVIFFVLLWHRFSMGRHHPGAAAVTYDDKAAALRGLLPWKDILRKGLLRAASLLFKLACVSVPMILAMEWCINSGALNFWERLVPETVSKLFPEQLLTIMAAQLGGLIQSSTVCAGLKAQGLITNSQILLAMLIASVVTNPARTIRRNLPTALAIFPARIGCAIVLGMQAARLLVTLSAATLLLIWMHAQIAG